MKTAFITGASRGIGFGVAKGLIEDGYNICAVSRKISDLEESFSTLKKQFPNSKIITIQADVSKESEITKAFETASKELGNIYLVFNNAGVYSAGSVTASTDEFTEIVNVNLIGAYTVAKLAVEHFKKNKSGHLINTTSVCGVHAFAFTGAYSATKFGLMGLNEALFRELAEEGIKVTAIGPSWVNTDMAAACPFPLSEAIQPEDIYKTVKYLLSLSANACPREIILECLKNTI
jgi:NAD(P)-dependent dehydrogenase (short-subunit alcohol dehydrogenase family)